MAESLGEAYPKEQARIRDLIAGYESLRNTPAVNVEFAIAMLRDVQRRADVAAASGHIVEMLRLYKEMEGCE